MVTFNSKKKRTQDSRKQLKAGSSCQKTPARDRINTSLKKIFMCEYFLFKRTKTSNFQQFSKSDQTRFRIYTKFGTGIKEQKFKFQNFLHSQNWHQQLSCTFLASSTSKIQRLFGAPLRQESKKTPNGRNGLTFF